MGTRSIQDELLDQLAKEMAAEMDFAVMADLMIRDGWTKVTLDRFKNNNHAVDISYWTADHAKGKFIRHGTTYVFEEKGDAVNFALKWA